MITDELVLSPVAEVVQDMMASDAVRILDESRASLASKGIKPEIAGTTRESMALEPPLDTDINMNFIAFHTASLAQEIAVDYAAIIERKRNKQNTAERERTFAEMIAAHSDYVGQVAQLYDTLPSIPDRADADLRDSRISKENFLEHMKLQWDAYEFPIVASAGRAGKRDSGEGDAGKREAVKRNLSRQVGNADIRRMAEIHKRISEDPALLMDHDFLGKTLERKITVDTSRGSLEKTAAAGVDFASLAATHPDRTPAGLRNVGRGMTTKIGPNKPE